MKRSPRTCDPISILDLVRKTGEPKEWRIYEVPEYVDNAQRVSEQTEV